MRINKRRYWDLEEIEQRERDRMAAQTIKRNAAA